jgi:hypothetical protein
MLSTLHYLPLEENDSILSLETNVGRFSGAFYPNVHYPLSRAYVYLPVWSFLFSLRERQMDRQTNVDGYRYSPFLLSLLIMQTKSRCHLSHKKTKRKDKMVVISYLFLHFIELNSNLNIIILSV